MRSGKVKNRRHEHLRKNAFLAVLFAVTSTTGLGSTRAHAQSLESLSARFNTCGERRRVNCVVDGDTFWLDGIKIRIADIDAPEISRPACTAERRAGEMARRRLLTLLNGGTFSLRSGTRDEDRYGRKLRTVERDHRSLGEMLVEEGLARRWDGPARNWCSPY